MSIQSQRAKNTPSPFCDSKIILIKYKKLYFQKMNYTSMSDYGKRDCIWTYIT